jgi:hypothetical protein
MSSVRTLILEFVDSHIRELHVEILRCREGMPSAHADRAMLFAGNE